MSFLAWAGRFEIYRQALAANVAARPAGSMSLTLFRNESIRPLLGNCYASPPWGCGPSVQLEVPPLPHQGSLQLDLALGCAGDTDVTCEQWDYVVQLRACCLPSGLSAILSAASAAGVEGPQCDAQSGSEIGRWITSFSRGVGRWHTDVTALAPVLTGRWCNFTMYTVPWEGNQGLIPWIATLSLVVLTVPAAPPPPPMPPMPPMLALPILAPWAPATSATATIATAPIASTAVFSPIPTATSLASASTAGAPKGTPVVYQPWGAVSSNLGGIESVFQWIFFNQSYNALFPPFAFSVPNGSKVLLMATITGHGNDNNGCGEFCATEHRFSVNAQPAHVKRQLLPITDPQLGCADEVDTGVTPNEYGTWLYGRNGWCNGREVVPWVIDLSDDIGLTGEAALIAPDGLPCMQVLTTALGSQVRRSSPTRASGAPMPAPVCSRTRALRTSGHRYVDCP
jgi:hypothetical protein